MNPIFSLLCPTRNRVQYLERFLGTLSDTINRYERIEVLFAYDNDDIITKAYLNQCRKRFGFIIKLFEVEQSDFLNRDYYNMLASKAVGEFKWLVGDDLLFIKKDWDIFLINKINEFFIRNLSRAVYIRIKDDTPKPEGAPDYANFPMISQEAIQTIGFFMPSEIPSWSGDYLVYLIYSHAKSNRVLFIEDIIVTHTSSHTNNKIESDELGIKQRKVYTKYNVFELTKKYEEEVIPLLRGKLFNYLQTHLGKRRNAPISLDPLSNLYRRIT